MEQTKKTLTGTSLVGDSVNRERVKEDYYATPKEATESLLNSLDLSGCESFYEPACGEGHISKVLEKIYPNADIHSTDLINRGFGVGNIDFLKLDSFTRKFDCIITNPPFKLSQEFIKKGLKLSNRYVIMFAKIQLLEGIARRKLFDKFPPKYIYVFTERVNPLRNGSPVDENGKKWASTMCFAWFVWKIGFSGEPIIRWLNLTKLKNGGKFFSSQP
jgi:hypothetical protein